MTGVNYRKIRHYAPAVNGKNLRPDVDIRAILFREANSLLISQERLIANVSVKAAMPTIADSDGKKRGLESAASSKYVNNQGMVYDPSAKYEPGKIFKSHVTETERIEAMKMAEPYPNWGWLDADYERNGVKVPNNVKVVTTEYSVDPRTGKPIMSNGIEIKAALGKTIREMKPGSNLGARAAKAFGVVVDALGKFRCPPGTPAANRFTNERGEGCFSITAAAQLRIVDALSSLLQPGSNDRASIVQSLLGSGVSAQEIRETFSRDGIPGLRNMLSNSGTSFVGDEWVDASYRTSALKKILDRAQDTAKSVSGIRRKTAQRQDHIDAMMAKYGITPTDDNSDIVELMMRMQADGLFSSEFDINSFFIGGNAENHRNALKDTLFAGAWNSGLTDADRRQYMDDVANNKVTDLTTYVDTVLDRAETVQRGNLQGIILMQEKYPDAAKKLNFGLDLAEGDPNFHAEARWTGSGQYLINFNPAVGMKGLQPFPGEGKMHLITATGGTQEEQWAAISQHLSHQERMKTWVESHMTDLAAAQGNGWEDLGAEVAIHEMMHILQMEALTPLIEKYSGKRITDLTNDEIADYQYSIMVDPAHKLTGSQRDGLAGDLKDVFGTDMEDLAARRLDALAGSYSQDEQQKILGYLNAYNNNLPVVEDGRRLTQQEILAKYKQSLTTAMMETLAEMGAAREMGLIEGSEIDEVLSFVDKVDLVTPSIPSTTPPPPPLTPGLIIPGMPPLPGGTIILPGGGAVPVSPPRPSIPIDAPTPVIPSKPRPRPFAPALDDAELDLVGEPDAWGLNDPDPSGIPSTPAQVNNTPGRGRRSKVSQEIADESMNDNALNKNYQDIRKKLKETKSKPNSVNGRVQALMEEKFGTKDLDDLTDEQLLELNDHLKNLEYETYAKAEKLKQYIDSGQWRGTEMDDTLGDRSDNKASELYNRHKKLLSDARGFGFSASSVSDAYDLRKEKARRETLSPEERAKFISLSVDDVIYFRNPRLGLTSQNLNNIAAVQRSVMTPEELLAVDSASVDVPKVGSIISGDVRKISLDVRDQQNAIRAFKDNGIPLPSGMDIEEPEAIRTANLMSAIDKSDIRKDIVVEFEADITPGSGLVDVSELTKAEIVVDRPERTSGMQSRIGGAAALIGSKRARKLLTKAGMQEKDADNLQFAASLATAFATTGPYGVAAILARRGGRDAADYWLKKAVENGWIDPAAAVKLEQQILNRVAPEGLPDDLINALERSKDTLLNDATKEKARGVATMIEGKLRDMNVGEKVEAAKEWASEFDANEKLEAAKEFVAEFDAAETAEKARELAGAALSRLKRKKKDTDIIEDVPDAANTSLTNVDPFAVDPFGNQISVIADMPDPGELDPFKSLFVQGLETKEAKPQQSKRKQKIRLLVPEGSKGTVLNGGSKNSALLLPPGKIQVGMLGEDGVANAEVVSQMNTENYLKSVSDSMNKLSEDKDFDVKKFAQNASNLAVKKIRDRKLSGSTPSSLSAASKATIEKSQSIIDRAEENGLYPFKQEHFSDGNEITSLNEIFDKYENSINDGLTVLRSTVTEIISDDYVSPRIKSILEKNSDTELREIIRKFALSIHNSFDRRARIKISQKELNELARSGSLPVKTLPRSVAILKNRDDAMIGISSSKTSVQSMTVELVHESQLKNIEEMLYSKGTKVGSEEFYDSGRGIEIILRAENAVRIGYGKLQSVSQKPTFVPLTDDNENQIELAMFGDMPEDETESSRRLAIILEAAAQNKPENIITSNNESIFTAKIIGDVSLDDIEHIKIPSSLLGVSNKPIPELNPVAGREAIVTMLKNRGASMEKIQDFIEKGGNIGGKKNSIFAVYMLEVPAAKKMKEKLISAGIPDVLFTNKNGIDIVSDSTWGTVGQRNNVKGEDALRELAAEEISRILDTVQKKKQPEKPKPAKNPKKEPAKK
jgi:hypothetical protein